MPLTRPSRDARRAIRRRTRRVFGARLHAAVAGGLAIALAVLLGALALRLEASYTLPFAANAPDDATLHQLALLDTPVSLTAVIERGHPASAPVRQLLRRLRKASPHLHVRHLDPYRDVSAAADLLDTFETRVNALLFESRGQRLAIPADDLFDYADTPGNGAPRPVAFRGEAVCAAALARLASARTPVAYALSGHGERDFADYDPLAGYSSFAREIRRQGYDLRILPPLSASGVPADCDVLVAAGPRDTLSPGEAALVSDYVLRGGSLLLLARRDALTGLEPLLARFGVSILPYVALSPQTLTGADVVADRFAEHPITRNLHRSTVVFSSPGVLSTVPPPAPGAPRADPRPEDRYSSFRATAIVGSPASLRRDDTSPRPDAPARNGLALFVAAERGTNAVDLAFHPPRIAVAADPHLGSNAMLGRGRNGNRTLLLSALDWLASNPAADAFAPPANLQRPPLARRRKALFVALSVAGFPGAILLLGAATLARRNRKVAPTPLDKGHKGPD
jgi:hypothetical protein